MPQLCTAAGPPGAGTVLEAGPGHVLGLRTAARDGYAAPRIALGGVAERKLTKGELGEFKKASLEPHRHGVEIRGYDGLEAGQGLKAEIFSAGEIVDVTSHSKGKGCQGLMQRHTSSRAPEAHASRNFRQPGATRG